MKKNRILSFVKAQKLSLEEADSISASGGTSRATLEYTAQPGGGNDIIADVAVDM